MSEADPEQEAIETFRRTLSAGLMGAGQLAERGILYAPDYCVNAGGVIQVADELDPNGFDFDRAKARAARIYDTTLAVLERAATEGVSPSVAADREAERRIREVGRLRPIMVPAR